MAGWEEVERTVWDLEALHYLCELLERYHGVFGLGVVLELLRVLSQRYVGHAIPLLELGALLDGQEDLREVHAPMIYA